VEADATQLRQIVMNLLTNAAEALEGKGGVVSLRTSERTLGPSEVAKFKGVGLAPGPYLLLEVTDTGCGMDSTTLARIFEPFFTTKLTGRGLGLAATLGIVRSHAGGICISSQLGQGTSIQIAFPAGAEGSSRATPSAHKEHQEIYRPASGRVLIVDDEQVVRLVTAGALESAGYEVLEAEDGQGGLDLYRQHGENLDLVILDVTMPGMDGEETLMHMQRHHQGVPVMVISGYSAEETARRFNTHQVTGFLHKPFRANELLEKVHHILGASAESTTKAN
jgi:CheY-like chemotaxis protein